MYSFLFSHRSSRSPLVLFTSLSHHHHFLSCTHNSLFRTFLQRISLFFLFFFVPFTLQRVQHVQSPIYIMYTTYFENFPMIMFLTHSLSPFARDKSSNRCVLFSFSFFQCGGPPVTPVTLSMQEKKNIYIYKNERKKNKTKEREKRKKTNGNKITQIRKIDCLFIQAQMRSRLFPSTWLLVIHLPFYPLSSLSITTSRTDGMWLRFSIYYPVVL